MAAYCQECRYWGALDASAAEDEPKDDESGEDTQGLRPCMHPKVSGTANYDPVTMQTYTVGEITWEGPARRMVQDDIALVTGYDACELYLLTGPSFGCVHWAQRIESPNVLA